jgi:hypothetical protein
VSTFEKSWGVVLASTLWEQPLGDWILNLWAAGYNIKYYSCVEDNEKTYTASFASNDALPISWCTLSANLPFNRLHQFQGDLATEVQDHLNQQTNKPSRSKSK